MDSRDMDRVWTLLGKCRLGDDHLNDKDLKKAWALVLEPYDYNDVKWAIVNHFRRKRFWPEIGEITEQLPYIPPPPPPSKLGRMAAEFAALTRALEQIKPRTEKDGDHGTVEQ